MAIISFDDEAIVNELLADILFISIFIHLNARILIVVSQISVSFCEGCCGVSSGYLSTLIIKYKNKQSLFTQSIEDKCNLDIYDEEINLYYHEETTPNKI